jgi:hypothetical protein
MGKTIQQATHLVCLLNNKSVAFHFSQQTGKREYLIVWNRKKEDGRKIWERRKI